MPLTLFELLQLGGTLLSNFGSEIGAKPIPPESNGFMRNINAVFMKKVFHISQRE